VHDRHRLRGREREIETRGPVRPGPVQPDPSARVDTFEHRVQRGRFDSAVEAERCGMRAEPDSGGFADTEVVVLAAGRDRVQVIRLYAFEWGARVRIRGGAGRFGQVIPPVWSSTRSR